MYIFRPTMNVVRLLRRLLSLYILITTYILSLKLPSFPFFLLIDVIATVYFKLCNLSSTTVDLDHSTTMHFWISAHRRFNKPNLLLIHGYGGNSKWQFVRQVRRLSQHFNLYVPDLLFFGDSYTIKKDRTVEFQAECVSEGMRRLGVDKCSVYAISYGGYVGFRMAEICGEMVDKVVIMSSGIGATEEQMKEQVNKIGRNAVDLLLPENPQDLRLLMDLAIYTFDPFKWLPNCMLNDFIRMTCNDHRREKQELVEELMDPKNDSKPIPVLTQETLLIWGDQDNVFPLSLAYQLQRHLGPKSRLEIVKDAGHAANIDSPNSLTDLIIPFVLGTTTDSMDPLHTN